MGENISLVSLIRTLSVTLSSCSVSGVALNRHRCSPAHDQVLDLKHTTSPTTVLPTGRWKRVSDVCRTKLRAQNSFHFDARESEMCCFDVLVKQ